MNLCLATNREGGVVEMDALEEEIALFWSKSREEVEKDLADAGLDPAPVAEAITKLVQEKLGVSALK